MEAGPDKVVSLRREGSPASEDHSDFATDQSLEVFEHQPVEDRSGFAVGESFQFVLVSPLGKKGHINQKPFKKYYTAQKEIDSR